MTRGPHRVSFQIDCRPLCIVLKRSSETIGRNAKRPNNSRLECTGDCLERFFSSNQLRRIAAVNTGEANLLTQHLMKRQYQDLLSSLCPPRMHLLSNHVQQSAIDDSAFGSPTLRQLDCHTSFWNSRFCFQEPTSLSDLREIDFCQEASDERDSAIDSACCWTGDVGGLPRRKEVPPFS